MRAARTLLSAEEFDNYPFEEDKRYELDEGELIEMTRPAYKHNRVLQKLLVKLVGTWRKIQSARRWSRRTSMRFRLPRAVLRMSPSFWVTTWRSCATPRSSTSSPTLPPKFSPPA